MVLSGAFYQKGRVVMEGSCMFANSAVLGNVVNGIGGTSEI